MWAPEASQPILRQIHALEQKPGYSTAPSTVRCDSTYLWYPPERALPMTLDDIAEDIGETTDEQESDDGSRFYDGSDDDATVDTETYREDSDIGL